MKESRTEVQKVAIQVIMSTYNLTLDDLIQHSILLNNRPSINIDNLSYHEACELISCGNSLPKKLGNGSMSKFDTFMHCCIYIPVLIVIFGFGIAILICDVFGITMTALWLWIIANKSAIILGLLLGGISYITKQTKIIKVEIVNKEK